MDKNNEEELEMTVDEYLELIERQRSSGVFSVLLYILMLAVPVGGVIFLMFHFSKPYTFEDVDLPVRYTFEDCSYACNGHIATMTVFFGGDKSKAFLVDPKTHDVENSYARLPNEAMTINVWSISSPESPAPYSKYKIIGKIDSFIPRSKQYLKASAILKNVVLVEKYSLDKEEEEFRKLIAEGIPKKYLHDRDYKEPANFIDSTSSGFDPERERLKALLSQAEADNVFRVSALKTRKNKIEKALSHEQLNTSNGGIIDSFMYAGDVFEVCELSYPGPIYSCR